MRSMACDRLRYGVNGGSEGEEDTSSSDRLLISACKEGQETVPRFASSEGIVGKFRVNWDLAVVVVIVVVDAGIICGCRKRSGCFD